MRLIQLLIAAETKLNYQLVEANNNGSHTIQFVKDNVVCGHIKSNSQGTSWDLPNDVAALNLRPVEGDYANTPEESPE